MPTPQPPDAELTSIEFRAGLIADPVQRLRFLRGAMSDALPEAGAVAPWQRSGRWAWLRRHRRLALSVAGAGALLLPLSTVSESTRAVSPPPRATAPVAAPAVPARPPGEVWLVETKDGVEAYSNGLHIETSHETRFEPRTYLAYSRANDYAPEATARTQAAGIVYHTTESHQAPFAASQNAKLQRVGAGLLAYIRQNQSYHFVIDRFGRVFRVVREADVANHAGYSVWADAQWAYLNLNHSFLGVAFEAQTGSGGGRTTVSPAQVHAARVLTEMLRSRYRIAAENCVTHAQVSVNRVTNVVGYHTDWASDFPFREIGLADNYELPLPSLYAFGFRYDAAFLRKTGARQWPGLEAAERQVWSEAGRRRVPVAQYRAALQERYHRLLATLTAGSPEGETRDGSQEERTDGSE